MKCGVCWNEERGTKEIVLGESVCEKCSLLFSNEELHQILGLPMKEQRREIIGEIWRNSR